MTRKTLDPKSAMQLALDHVVELREAWMTGAISEHDGKGGTRSNRNVDVEMALRAAIDSLPAAEPDAGERVERPPMLLAATCRPFAPITDWHWCVRSTVDWLVVDSDMWFIYSKDFIGVDRTASDEAALKLYDQDIAASRPATL